MLTIYCAVIRICTIDMTHSTPELHENPVTRFKDYIFLEFTTVIFPEEPCEFIEH
jgi:hypothetical protein